MYPIPEGEPMDGWPNAAALKRAADVLDEAGCTHPQTGPRAEDVARAVLEAAGLPELMGHAAAAETLGTTAPNMTRWRSLPAPLYDLPAGKFYEADAIRELAARRREGATT